MVSIEEHEALKYLFCALGPDEDGNIYSYSLEEVRCGINLAPSITVKSFLKRYCRTVEHLEEYLNRHEDYFWVENGKVALYPYIKDSSDKAVSYFEDILDSYEILPNYKNFYGHIGQADKDIKEFLQMFYHGDFKQFLLNNSDVFVVFNDDTVSLIENEANEAVKYFQQRLREGREGWHYMNLRGCVGQAGEHIINFINDCYPEEDFLTFLEYNSNAFEVDTEGLVYLN